MLPIFERSGHQPRLLQQPSGSLIVLLSKAWEHTGSLMAGAWLAVTLTKKAPRGERGAKALDVEMI